MIFVDSSQPFGSWHHLGFNQSLTPKGLVGVDDWLNPWWCWLPKGWLESTKIIQQSSWYQQKCQDLDPFPICLPFTQPVRTVHPQNRTFGLTLCGRRHLFMNALLGRSNQHLGSYLSTYYPEAEAFHSISTSGEGMKGEKSSRRDSVAGLIMKGWEPFVVDFARKRTMKNYFKLVCCSTCSRSILSNQFLLKTNSN